MAQDGPHDHQYTASSNELSLAPPKTMTSTLSPGENNTGENNNSGSRTGNLMGKDDVNKGKNIMPNDIQGGEHGLATHGTSRSKGKGLALGVASSDGDGFPTGNRSAVAADDGDLKVHIIMERERRRQMKEMFNTLHSLMPHVPEKVDKATLVEETINYIKALEQTKAQLEKRKQEKALARQAAAEAAASSLLAPRTAQGMAAMSDGWGPVLPQQPPSAMAAPPLLATGMGPVGFQTWSAPNVVLSVMNDEAIINVCAPRKPRMLTMVLSVLNRHMIDVITSNVVANGAQSFFTFNTIVNGAGGKLAEDIYKLAVSEIMLWLSN